MAANIITDTLRKSQFDASTFAAVNFASDSIYMMLVNTTGDSVADNTKRGYTYESDANGNEISGTGYTARGQALTSLSLTQTSHVVTFSSANPAWTTSTLTTYGGYLLKHTGSASTSPLIAYYTFGGAVSTVTGTLTVVVNASGWLTVSGG